MRCLSVSRKLLTFEQAVCMRELVFRFRFQVRVRVTPAIWGTQIASFAVAQSEQTVETKSINVLGNREGAKCHGATSTLFEVISLAHVQPNIVGRVT